MSHIDQLSYTLAMVMGLGGLAFALNYKTRISTVPVLLLLGVLAGPVAGLIDRSEAGDLFGAVRVIGLVAILFAEGHSLEWPLLRRHLKAVTLLDTLGLALTAVLAGLAFSWAFDAPLLVGMLFGAIISATDPATLVPLFRNSRIDQDTETLIVAESIFNDPLGIVLTLVVVALVLPGSDTAHRITLIAAHTGPLAAAVLYFLYDVVLSLTLGAALGIATRWVATRLAMQEFAVLLGLSVALGGFVLGDVLGASGYLVATSVGIVMGNHRFLFSGESPGEARRVEDFLNAGRDFQNLASALATVMIFVLLGASLDPTALGNGLVPAVLVAIGVMLVARPLAVLPLLASLGWPIRRSLFVALEGPRGVVPAALAGLPLALGQQYHDDLLLHWGPMILTTTLVTVLLSVTLETVWVDTLKHRLLEGAGKRGNGIESATARK
ncbi:MAG: sodium:proton antiporter [Chromatiaceae bacterium]